MTLSLNLKKVSKRGSAETLARLKKVSRKGTKLRKKGKKAVGTLARLKKVSNGGEVKEKGKQVVTHSVDKKDSKGGVSTNLLD